jgi:hypothetical protein
MKLHYWNGNPQGRDRGTPKALDDGINSGEQRHGEVGPWVREMAGEEAVRLWSATARQGIGGRGVGAAEMARVGVGVGGNSSTTTTCKGIRAHGVAHVADVRREARATDAWASSCHAHEASDRAPFKRRLRLTSGPGPFSHFLRFSNTQRLIFKLVTFLMSKYHQI